MPAGYGAFIQSAVCYTLVSIRNEFRRLGATLGSVYWGEILHTDYARTFSISVPLYQAADPSDWARVKSLLWSPSGAFHELEEAFDQKNIQVTVVGMEPSKSCAIIGPFLNIFGNNFYVLPYSVI